MTLLLIFLGIVLLLSIVIGIVSEEWDMFFLPLMMGAVLATLLWLGIGLVGLAVNTKTERVVYDVPIVSLKDGSQVEGHFSGGLFVMRGNIGETQYFSYYKNNGNGSYSLDKKEADRSVIIPDATPETAKVTITDDITTCTNTWWFAICPQPGQRGVYVHGDFHVPANSIKNDFVLDAQ